MNTYTFKVTVFTKQAELESNSRILVFALPRYATAALGAVAREREAALLGAQAAEFETLEAVQRAADVAADEAHLSFARFLSVADARATDAEAQAASAAAQLAVLFIYKGGGGVSRYKILFYFEACVHESIFPLLPPLT